jgi:hypothetical protein
VFPYIANIPNPTIFKPSIRVIRLIAEQLSNAKSPIEVMVEKTEFEPFGELLALVLLHILALYRHLIDL